MTTRPKPTALIILDGWGYREETANNAIANAQTQSGMTCWNAIRTR